MDLEILHLKNLFKSSKTLKNQLILRFIQMHILGAELNSLIMLNLNSAFSDAKTHSKDMQIERLRRKEPKNSNFIVFKTI